MATKPSASPAIAARARREPAARITARRTVVSLLGRTHALSGVVTGVAIGSQAMHLAPLPLALFAGLNSAYALASDIDQCGSTEARSFGFLTEALAWCIRKI